MTIKVASAPAAFNKTNATVVSATGTTFTVNYGASTPGTWTGLGDAVTTAVTKDDIGNTPISWVDAVCTNSTSGPAFYVNFMPTISLTGGGTGSIYRKTIVLQVPMTFAGRITFYQQGKPIPGCKNIYFNAVTATCSWKPAQHGPVMLSAVVNPSSGTLVTASTGYLQVNVDVRNDNR